jgi:hypothetical protein
VARSIYHEWQPWMDPNAIGDILAAEQKGSEDYHADPHLKLSEAVTFFANHYALNEEDEGELHHLVWQLGVEFCKRGHKNGTAPKPPLGKIRNLEMEELEREVTELQEKFNGNR